MLHESRVQPTAGAVGAHKDLPLARACLAVGKALAAAPRLAARPCRCGQETLQVCVAPLVCVRRGDGTSRGASASGRQPHCAASAVSRAHSADAACKPLLPIARRRSSKCLTSDGGMVRQHLDAVAAGEGAVEEVFNLAAC